MVKFFIFLFVVALLYACLGVLVEFIFLKRADQQFTLDADTAIRILSWPKRIKDM